MRDRDQKLLVNLRTGAALSFLLLLLVYLVIVCFAFEQKYREQERLLDLRVVQASLFSGSPDALRETILEVQERATRDQIAALQLIFDNDAVFRELASVEGVDIEEFISDLISPSFGDTLFVTPGERTIIQSASFSLTEVLGGSFSVIYFSFMAFVGGVCVYLSAVISRQSEQRLSYDELSELVVKVIDSEVDHKGTALAMLVAAFTGSQPESLRLPSLRRAQNLNTSGNGGKES